MTLVELAQKWKDGEINDQKVRDIYEKINVYEPENIDGEWFFTRGDGNSWLEVGVETNLTCGERVRLKKILGVIEFD